MMCNRSFFGKSCYNEHKRERGINDSVCKKVCRCLNCKRTLTTGLKDHICGHSICSNCKEYDNMSTHKCYMTVKECKGGVCTGNCLQ